MMTQPQKSHLIKKKNQLGKVELETVKKAKNDHQLPYQFSYLHNYLEPLEFLINQLINRLKLTNNSSKNCEIADPILEIIRYCSDARLALVMQHQSQVNWTLKSQSKFNENTKQDTCLEILNSDIIETISHESIFNSAYFGLYKIYDDDQGVRKAFVIVPLHSQPQAEVMVVYGLPAYSYFLTDAYGQIIASFYHASKHSLWQPALVEASVLDNLKRIFGFVSSSLYERRFHLFCERLRSMVVHFEPVLHLDPVELFISGWEALARDPKNGTAPIDLFAAAELWGPRFTIELDQYFLQIAARSYREARRKAKQGRANEIAPLSVNVYPETLMRTAYLETVRQLVQDKIISPRHLILEISEKTQLPQFDHGIPLEAPLKVFKDKLLQYVREFKIRFGVDDFGVGYASVSRLAVLNPPYVKIDREMLYYQPIEVIIRFVHEFMEADTLRSTTDVIIEGVDENSPISLYRLKQIGVSYIQGHIVGKSGPEIYRLSQDKAEFLRQQLLNPAQ